MNLTLTRKIYRADGILSTLSSSDLPLVACTLEHAYPSAVTWQPKIPPGVYECIRSQHLLHGMTDPFTTFEVMGVAGHTGILFHWGNFNEDSEGCILLGESFGSGPRSMVTNSRDAFSKFMALQDGVEFFPITVVG